ncbi:MAG: penicillin acylase family protein [Candidatus Dormibacteria bacterium]
MILLLCGLGAVPATAAGEGQYLVNDPGTAAGVRNVLPAGEAGVISLTDYIHHMADPTWYPPHVHDQAALYDGPTFTPAGMLTDQQLQQFSKEETFGVADGQVESIETPQPGLVIIRDKAFGVPHIFATTKALAEYGAGWVSAEDRLFMMDVLRHAGRGNLSSLVGSSGYDNDCGAHYGTGYDQADADLQKSRLDPQVVADGTAFANGVNAWIASPGFVQHMPVEYNAFPLPVGPNAWTVEDTGAVGALIGSQLGGGGGNEVGNTLAYENMVSIYGVSKGRKLFDDLHAANDPESPTTINQAFPYESRAQVDKVNLPSVALIDARPSDPNGCTQTRVPPAGVAGAIVPQPVIALPASSRAIGPATRATIASAAARSALGIVSAVRYKKHASNSQVVNASDSASGHPIADFGSQAAYWMPEIWMEMDVHAPDWNNRGFQFPGTGLFIEIGRGKDFAWSATSAGSDNIDQRADLLCNPTPLPGTGPLDNVDPNSTHYYYKGQCLAMTEKQLQYVVPPSPGTLPNIPPKGTDLGLPWVGLETFRVERTVHDDGIGIVQGRTTALLNGEHVPVAITTQRTNFLHELEQGIGFEKWNSDSAVHDAKSFITAAQSVDTTFNWFYVDAHDTAYYSSGKLPMRNPAADPDLLNWGTGAWDWLGILPPSMHPQAINPPKGWMTSWNNRPAPQFGSSDSNWDYGSLYRSQLLDRELQKRLAAGGGKLTPTDLFNNMQVASVTDFRAQRLVDEILAIIGPGTLQPSQQAALAAIASWHSAGDLRQDVGRTGNYAHSDGISYFDATYPHIIQAVFNPWFNSTTYDAYCQGNHSPGGIPKSFDNPPSDGHCYGGFSGYNVGSSYDGGWMDALDKDFRQLLGRPVQGAHSVVFCGGGHASGAAPQAPVNGTLATCRAELLASLDRGIIERYAPGKTKGTANFDYPALMQNDMIDYRSLGLFALPTEQWANKPTQQQFVQFTADRTSLTTTPAAVAMVTGGTPNTARGSLIADLLLLAACLLLLGAATGARRHRA